MKKIILSFISFFIIHAAIADTLIPNHYAAPFDKAYSLHPEILRGMPEAVSFCNTHFTHITQAWVRPKATRES